MKRVLYIMLLLASFGVQAQDLMPWPTDTIDGKVYYRYTVEKSIGLYRISKNFGVSQEAILQANPELRTRGLRYEEVILVPANLPVVAKVQETPQPAVATESQETQVIQQAQESYGSQEVPVAPVVTETAEKNDTPRVADVIDTAEVIQVAEHTEILPDMHYTDTIRLAFMLPLQAGTAQRNPTIDRFYDFYAGALLALKHHEPVHVDHAGVKHTTYYDVHTYDVGKDTRMLYQLLDSGSLPQPDVIIGPAYNQQVKAISAYAAENRVPVIVPFLQAMPEIKTNPYLMKFNPSEEVQAHALMEYLDTLRNRINIVMVDAGKADIPSGVRILRDSIKARRFPVAQTSIRQILSDSISSVLQDSVENILLFHSERYSNIQLLMPYLLSGRRGKQLTILSHYAWQNERILLPQLYTGVFHTSDSEGAARYEQDFAQYFGHQLSSTQPRYDLLGYDLTMYVLEALQDGVFRVPESLYNGLQSSILFTPIENGGYENTHIIIQRR